jgi:hypothetical protein
MFQLQHGRHPLGELQTQPPVQCFTLDSGDDAEVPKAAGEAWSGRDGRYCARQTADVSSG